MIHILPQSHLGLLQGILRELISQRDEDAEFVQLEPEPDPEPQPVAIGKP